MKPFHSQSAGTVLNAGRNNAGGRAREGKGRRANLWFFHSNKRNQLLSICGDVFFAHVVFAEIDPSILTYSWAGESERSDNGKLQEKSTDLTVRFIDGTQQIWRCRRSASKDVPPTSDECNIPVLLKTEKDVEAQTIRLDNALLLCAALTAARNYDLAPSHQAIRHALLFQKEATFGQLTSLDGYDPALLQAALTRLYLEREVAIDLDSKLLSRNTMVSRLASGGQR